MLFAKKIFFILGGTPSGNIEENRKHQKASFLRGFWGTTSS